jgi:hypothetical protein
LPSRDHSATSGLPPVEAWSAVIRQVEALAAKVGGIGNLKRCLEAAAGLAAFTEK